MIAPARFRELRLRWPVARAVIRGRRAGPGTIELVVTAQPGPGAAWVAEVESADWLETGRAAIDLLRPEFHAPANGRAGPPAGRWVIDAAAGFEHADVPGLVSVTIDSTRAAGDASPLIVYARTSLLIELAVPGGCADRPTADLWRADPRPGRA